MYQLNFFYKNDPRKNIYMFVSDNANTLAEAKEHFHQYRQSPATYLLASHQPINSIKTDFINVITDLQHRYTKKQYAH